MKYRFHITDVFTTSAFGGNQLAVLPNAAGLSDQGMQHIAREFNFTETTFVLPPQTKANTCRVRIFTPRAEVQFAGHPIVGTACALVEGGHFGRRDAPRTDLILEEGVGPISAVVKPIGELLEATFTLHGKLEQADVPASKADMARVLGIRSEGVLDVSSGSFGLPFTFAQLSSAEEVDRAALDHAAWSQHVAGSWAPQVFLFAQEGQFVEHLRSDVRARTRSARRPGDRQRLCSSGRYSRVSRTVVRNGFVDGVARRVDGQALRDSRQRDPAVSGGHIGQRGRHMRRRCVWRT